MIEIPRYLALHFRSLCRRIGLRTLTNSHPSVHFDAVPDELRIRVLGRDTALEYVLPGEFPICAFSMPLSALGEAGGTTHQTITLTPLPGGNIRLAWSSGPIPQQLDVETAGPPPAGFPAFPTNLTPNPASLHTALRHAVATADRETSQRYALDAVKLDGTGGRIVTTDGHQLLVQRGFTFPWGGDAILPTTKVFDAAELVQNDPVAVGRSDDWVAFTFGRWIVYVKHDKDAKFPKVDSLLADPAAARSTLHISESDADFLHRSLDVMPIEKDAERGVTIDVNGHVAVRARADHQSPPTEVVLSNSRYTGAVARASCDRRFLGRALKFGFRSLCLNAPGAPMFCDDGQRHYLWMPLQTSDDVPPAGNATRIESPVASNRRGAALVPRRPRPMSTPTNHMSRPREVPAERGAAGNQAVQGSRSAVSNKQGRRHAAPSASSLDEAVAVRDALRETLEKSRDLVRAIKRHNRQNRLVASTLQSLKEMQAVA